MKIVAFLPASNKASCATNDPSPSRCDCGAKKVPLVTLAAATAAVAAAAAPAIQQEVAALAGLPPLPDPEYDYYDVKGYDEGQMHAYALAYAAALAKGQK